MNGIPIPLSGYATNLPCPPEYPVILVIGAGL
jgi:hypothetical protein